MKAKTRALPKVISTPLFIVFFLSVLIGICTTVGCNFFGKVDNPGETVDRYLSAMALANSGDCKGARDVLISIRPQNDDIHAALGWAYLCTIGAKASVVATSIYNYSGGSNNLTVVGSLARALLPMDSDKQAIIELALGEFSQIQDAGKKSIQIAIAKFIKAAAILGLQSSNDGTGTLNRSDIAQVACNGADCTTGTANCNSPGMSDSSVTNFLTIVSEAGSELGNAGATELKTLADRLVSGLGAGGDAGRCFIVNNAIAND